MSPCISHPTNARSRDCSPPDGPPPDAEPEGPSTLGAGPIRQDVEPEGPEDEPMPLLGGDEDSAFDCDDAEASELDPGISIDDSLVAGDDGSAELVFDIAELLSQVDESDATDDATGPEEYHSTELPAVEHLGGADADDAQGFDGGSAELEFGDLPELDADGRGDIGIEQDSFRDAEISDDPLPPWSDAPWAETLVPVEQGFRCLSLGSDAVLLGGSVARFVDAGTAQLRRELSLESPAVSCALLPRGTTLVTDARGALLRAAPSSGKLECVPNWRARVHQDIRSSATLELHTVGSDKGRVLLGLTSGGRLLVGSEQGEWAPMELHARVLALGSSATPCVALLQSRRGRALVTSVDGGANWCTIDTPREVQELVGDEPPMLAAASTALLVAHRLRGVLLSIDAGRTFERVPGCSNVSAVCGGELAGLPAFWLALHSDTSEISSLILLRAPTWQPLRIGELRSARSGHADEEGTSRRLLALGWHGGRRRLWGVGDFGVASWEPVLAPLVS